MPGPGWYCSGEEEEREVLDVMESGHLVRYGKLDDPRFKQKVRLFENEFAGHCDARHALATATGSTAMVAAMKAMGLRPGDEVIVPAYGFIATYSSAIILGLVPVLAQIGDDLNIDPEDIERRITPKTKPWPAIVTSGSRWTSIRTWTGQSKLRRFARCQHRKKMRRRRVPTKESQYVIFATECHPLQER